MRKVGIFQAMKMCKDYEKLNTDERKKLQAERLKEMVMWAKEKSPFYAQLYGEISENFDLSDLPTVDKKMLMSHWDNWVTDRDITLAEVEKFMENSDNIGRKIKRKYSVYTTSGSTGNPLVSIYDDVANNIMGGISACRSYARKEDLKAFIKKGGRSAGVFADGGFYLANSNIRSRLIKMPWKKKKFGIFSALWPIEKIVQKLNEFQPVMLGGYPSNLELLIDEVKEGRLHISPILIMAGGEYLSDSTRQRLADTFQCYVQTSYNCTEGAIACECRYKHFHINDDWIIVEPVDAEGNAVPDGVQSDKLLLTNLYNFAQPFIRYEVTDRIIMHHDKCPCGNASPWVELEGRTDDLTSFMASEKEIKIAPLSIYAVLKEIHELKRFQVLVYSQNVVELRLEPQKGVRKEEAFALAKKCLEEFLESQKVTQLTVKLSEIGPQQDANSGKFKHIINRTLS